MRYTYIRSSAVRSSSIGRSADSTSGAGTAPSGWCTAEGCMAKESSRSSTTCSTSGGLPGCASCRGTRAGELQFSILLQAPTVTALCPRAGNSSQQQHTIMRDSYMHAFPLIKAQQQKKMHFSSVQDEFTDGQEIRHAKESCIERRGSRAAQHTQRLLVQ